MLASRGCGPFEYVEIVSDPSFSICKDYVAKADLDLIMTTEVLKLLYFRSFSIENVEFAPDFY